MPAQLCRTPSPPKVCTAQSNAPAISGKCSATPAQVALAWLNHRPGVTAPIASATTAAQLDELLAGATMPLAPEQMARLDAASA